MYSLAIHLYAFVVALISPFHKKARLMRFGQWKTNSILREKIDRNAKYIWFHASSLGEFEQGRPMIEKIKAENPHDELDMDNAGNAAMIANWRDVLAIYAVRTTTDDTSPDEVATLTAEKLDILRQIFWDMNAIS